MDLLYTITMALITLGVLVVFHEFGHFWVARLCGVKVIRFAIFFGRPLWRYVDRHNTEFVIGWLPLGGMVRMLDEREDTVRPEEAHLAFGAKTVWQRIAIVSAGPLANFLLAIVVFWLLFLRGETGIIPVVAGVEPDSLAWQAGIEQGQEIVSIDGHPTPTTAALSFRLLDRLGDTGVMRIGAKYPDSDVEYVGEATLDRWLAGAENPKLIQALGIELDLPVVVPRLESITEDGAAAVAGFRAGDLILSADGQPMDTWSDWVTYVRARPGVPMDVVIEREGQRQVLPLVPAATEQSGLIIGSVGMMVTVPSVPLSQQRRFERNPLEAAVAAWDKTADLVSFTFESVVKMLQGLISPANISGPIAIAQIAASSAESGLFAWLSFLALLSISLGAINLLPVPVLDGGHLLFYALEALTGRPVPEKVQAVGYQMGLAMVLSLMLFALYNDVVRL